MRVDEEEGKRLKAISARNRASKQLSGNSGGFDHFVDANEKVTTDQFAAAGKAIDRIVDANETIQLSTKRRQLPDAIPRPGKSSKSSKLEAAFAVQLSIAGLPVATREHRFHPKRRWQFDFAWPVFRLAVEIEGGLYGKSRHTTMTGFNADCEKYNTATLMGWRVLRVTDRHVKSGQALEWAREGIRR